MTKKELTNKWSLQPNLTIHSAIAMVDCSVQFEKDLDEYAEYVAKETWYAALTEKRNLSFNEFWNEFNNKENEK